MILTVCQQKRSPYFVYFSATLCYSNYNKAKVRSEMKKKTCCASCDSRSLVVSVDKVSGEHYYGCPVCKEYVAGAICHGCGFTGSIETHILDNFDRLCPDCQKILSIPTGSFEYTCKKCGWQGFQCEVVGIDYGAQCDHAKPCPKCGEFEKETQEHFSKMAWVLSGGNLG
jgi:hypothetical protein